MSAGGTNKTKGDLTISCRRIPTHKQTQVYRINQSRGQTIKTTEMTLTKSKSSNRLTTEQAIKATSTTEASNTTTKVEEATTTDNLALTNKREV